MTAVHIRRWRADDDDWTTADGAVLGSVSDLTVPESDDDTGLVMPDGTPILREPPAHRVMGFRAPDCE